MPLDTAEDLIHALRGSGLFAPEQMHALTKEIQSLQGDLQAIMRFLVDRDRVTVYQLKKVLHGKGPDLLIGPYVVLDKLGEGGMGKVFRAKQLRMDRTVALKVVRSSLVANPTVRGRYEREVQAATKLEHINIVRLLDAGESNGKFYLAMEFVDGIDLSRLMKQFKKLEIAEACEYVRQAALGLQHAHEQGFVHRDVKPSNIVVAGERHIPQATEPAIVKILDLGLARAIDPDDMVAPDLTRDHTVVGTPDYMSPEQAKNSKLVSPSADLYSLGCTLYFLLTGTVPFPGGNAIEKLMQHQLDQPAPLQGLRPGVPDAVAEIVSRCMAKKPENRPASADELATMLAPHARYPHGSAPVLTAPFAQRPVPASPSGETAPDRSTAPASALGSSVGASPLLDIPPEPVVVPQPVAPSDHTPRPPELDRVFAEVKANQRSESRNTRSSGKTRVVPRHTEDTNSQKRRIIWIAGGVVGLAVIVAILLAAFSGKSPQPQPPQAQNPPEPPPKVGPPQPKNNAITPVVNFSKLHAASALIPDGTGLVVVAYPSAYLKEKDSAFVKGTGHNKLLQFVSRYQSETEVNLTQTDRAILSFQAELPESYLLATEGPYLTSKFANDLDKNTRFTPYRPFAKAIRPFRAYSAGNDRAVGFFQPPLHYNNTAPVYFSMHGKDMVDKTGTRLFPMGWRANPDVEAGVLPALNAASESPPPLLLAVASGRMKMPLMPDSTVKDLGADLVVLAVRISDRVEIDIAIHAETRDAAKQFVDKLSFLFRDNLAVLGRQLSNSLNAALATASNTDDPILTLKIRWSPAEWSAFLNQITG